MSPLLTIAAFWIIGSLLWHAYCIVDDDRAWTTYIGLPWAAAMLGLAALLLT